MALLFTSVVGERAIGTRHGNYAPAPPTIGMKIPGGHKNASGDAVKEGMSQRGVFYSEMAVLCLAMVLLTDLRRLEQASSKSSTT